MANPGYPQMGQGPMMPMQGGPPMMGMPMGMQRPMRRGTSRAVPIVVSAGLAVGVFCGLLFGLGTGEEKASAEPAKGNNIKHGDDTTPAAGVAPTGVGGTAALPVGTPSAGAAAGGSPAKNPNAIATGAGKPATPAAGGATVPTVKSIKLTIKVEPDGAATGAKIVVDGKEITGTTIDVPADHKQVKLAVTANGFHSYDKKLDVVDGDMTVTVEMVKRGGGGAPASPGFGGASTGGNHVPTAPPKPKKPPNNGIIDI